MGILKKKSFEKQSSKNEKQQVQQKSSELKKMAELLEMMLSDGFPRMFKLMSMLA